MRHAARADANQAAIVAALRAAGATVYNIKLPVDLLVGFRGQTILMEIKDGAKPPSARKTTAVQDSFLGSWRGGPACVVTDVDGALRAISIL